VDNKKNYPSNAYYFPQVPDVIRGMKEALKIFNKEKTKAEKKGDAEDGSGEEADAKGKGEEKKPKSEKKESAESETTKEKQEKPGKEAEKAAKSKEAKKVEVS